MNKNYKKIRMLKDKKLFKKEILDSKSRRAENLKKEFKINKKLKQEDFSADIDVPEPLDFDEEKVELTTRFVSGENLRDGLDPEKFFKFGKELKIFHLEDGHTHGELEVQDVLDTSDNDEFDASFCVVDWPQMDTKHRLHDYARFKTSLFILQIKRPWNYFKIKKCLKAFTEGYNPKPKLSKPFLRKEINSIINSLYKRSLKYKLKGVILYLFVKPRVYLLSK